MRNLTKDEFRTYCLLFAANADFNITKQEIIAIGAKIDPEDFVRVYNWFEADNDRERIETIQANKVKYVKNEEDKNKLLDELKEVFFADGVFDSVERSIFLMLKKFL
ncbi:MAG: hypothetical protein MJZ90_03765 [Bacteroidales bacterium]|nr:hypothetical protein [Bacteroidales bacterium]